MIEDANTKPEQNSAKKGPLGQVNRHAKLVREARWKFQAKEIHGEERVCALSKKATHLPRQGS